jgi:hypothetical protein
MFTLLTDLKIAGIDIKYGMILVKIRHLMLVVQKDTTISLNSQVPRTPQRNGKVNRKFQPFYGRIRAMSYHAGFENGKRSGIWAEYARTITFLSNIPASKTKERCPYQLLFGSKPKLPSSFRIFGEIGVVTTKDNVQGKLKNRGTACILLGYSVHQANDVYRMINFSTKRIIHSRDVV